jgi:GNAT superfamily N-acetyltransferase
VPPWTIEKLDRRRHDCTAFDCGKPPLDDWLKQFAGQHERNDLARAYVLVTPGQVHVLGYYALSTCEIRPEALPPGQAKGIPRHLIVPGVLLGRLAVDRSIQRQGVGDALLFDALRLVAVHADAIGIRAVVVHAIDEEAAAFYRGRGFLEFLDNPLHLFLPMTVVRKLMLAPVPSAGG